MVPDPSIMAARTTTTFVKSKIEQYTLMRHRLKWARQSQTNASAAQ